MSNQAKRALPLLGLLLLAACSTTPTGVSSVVILGGDRDVPLAATTLLSPLVTAGSGVATSVTWSSSDETIATVDAAGLFTAESLGTTVITATSTADPTKSDTVTIEVVPPTIADGAFMATVTMPSSAPPAMGAGLVLVEPIVPTVVGPLASVVEIGDGFYAGPISPVDLDDGTVVIELPDAADLPSNLLTDVNSFVPNFTPTAHCSLQATDAEARLTPTVFEFVTVPGVLIYTAAGAGLSVVSSQPADPEDPFTPEFVSEARFYAWVYSDRDVTVTSLGAGCTTMAQFSVDLDLTQGWNRVAWDVEVDLVAETLTGLGLGNGDEGALYLTPVSLLGPPSVRSPSTD